MFYCNFVSLLGISRLLKINRRRTSCCCGSCASSWRLADSMAVPCPRPVANLLVIFSTTLWCVKICNIVQLSLRPARGRSQRTRAAHLLNMLSHRQLRPIHIPHCSVNGTLATSRRSTTIALTHRMAYTRGAPYTSDYGICTEFCECKDNFRLKRTEIIFYTGYTCIYIAAAA